VKEEAIVAGGFGMGGPTTKKRKDRVKMVVETPF